MRISDWSSDVCSSDLLRLRRDHRNDRQETDQRRKAVDEVILVAEQDRRAQDRRGGKGGADGGLAFALTAGIGRRAFGIGADGRDMDERAHPRGLRGRGDVPGAIRLPGLPVVNASGEVEIGRANVWTSVPK